MPEQNNKQVLISLDGESNDPSIQENELDFPWPLIDLIKKSKKTVQTTLSSVVYLLLSFHFQLLVMFMLSIVCIIVGLIYLNKDDARRMLCRAFIIQGACSLFVVLVHTCATIFE